MSLDEYTKSAHRVRRMSFSVIMCVVGLLGLAGMIYYLKSLGDPVVGVEFISHVGCPHPPCNAPHQVADIKNDHTIAIGLVTSLYLVYCFGVAFVASLPGD